MLSEQEGSHGMSESANPPGSQPIALPLFAVQPHNIIPVEIIAKRFLATTTDSAVSAPEQFNPPNVQLAIEEPIIQSESQQAQVLMNVQVISTDEPFKFESSDCTSLANLVDVAQQEGYRANVGFVTLDDEKLIRRKIARLHSLPALKAYGLDNLELLQNSPF